MNDLALFPEAPSTKNQEYRFKESELGVFNTKNSDAVVKNLKKDTRIIGLTNGEFSLIDLIKSTLSKTGKSHVIIATWSAGIKDAFQVKWLLEAGEIATIRLVTDHSYKTRQKKYALSIEDVFGKENIRTSEIHAKFVLIHNEDNFVAIRTSMNLNANKTCETFEIDNNKEIFDFYMNFIEHTFGTMPKGFTESSFKANDSLRSFFEKESKSEWVDTGWSDL